MFKNEVFYGCWFSLPLILFNEVFAVYVSNMSDSNVLWVVEHHM